LRWSYPLDSSAPSATQSRPNLNKTLNNPFDYSMPMKLNQARHHSQLLALARYLTPPFLCIPLAWAFHQVQQEEVPSQDATEAPNLVVRSLSLVNDKGQVQARLGCNEAGDGSLRFYQWRGAETPDLLCSIGHEDDGDLGVFMCAGAGTERGTIELGFPKASHLPRFLMRNFDHHKAIELDVTAQGEGRLITRDGSGKLKPTSPDKP
jgi:hypothetical protein